MADLEPIVGRYLRLVLGNRPHRVYFEEAGRGIPLVCLHTAGSDRRQFRHLMTDEAVTRHYRVIMQEIGHFPMSEHPEQFRKYLLPVLDEIHGLAR
jgi:pimeloyl-ACP methyl ester carboxylesterase